MNDPEEDLRTLFARLREADREQAPGFYAMRARALAPTPRLLPLWRWGLTAAAALGLLGAALLFRPASRSGPVTYDALAQELERAQASLHEHLAAQSELTTWQSPTDFLLHPIPPNHP